MQEDEDTYPPKVTMQLLQLLLIVWKLFIYHNKRLHEPERVQGNSAHKKIIKFQFNKHEAYPIWLSEGVPHHEVMPYR